MEKESLNVFFNRISKNRKVIGPKRNGKIIRFEQIDKFEDLVFNYERTLLPMKKVLYPAYQKLLEFRLDTNGIIQYLDLEIQEREEQKIIFGIHPCDIQGIRVQDEFFTGNCFVDPFYKRNRENTLIIGHSCIPDEKCLCNNTGSDNVNQAFDLFFNELKSIYLVWVGSTKADELIVQNHDLFDIKVTQENMREFNHWNEYRKSQFMHQFDISIMPKLIELSYESDLWDKLGEECLSCGACTNVCPTCGCYDVRDLVNLDDIGSGERGRHWDSCMFPQFSEVSGGGNFRLSRGNRLKLYYTHKLKGYQGKFEQPSCIGCGRCVDVCPVDINILRVANELMKVSP